RMVLPASRSRESMTRVPVSLQRGQRMQLPRGGYTSSGTKGQDTTRYGLVERTRQGPGIAMCSSRLISTNDGLGGQEICPASRALCSSTHPLSNERGCRVTIQRLVGP